MQKVFFFQFKDDVRDNTSISVMTEDFTNGNQVMSVYRILREELGIKRQVMYYKADLYSSFRIYRKNPWGLKATIFEMKGINRSLNKSYK